MTLECHARSAASTALAEPDRFDVVIADISFDSIDWFQATQCLRRGGFDRPIIALIYSWHEKSEQELLWAVITAVFTKPTDALETAVLVAQSLADLR